MSTRIMKAYLKYLTVEGVRLKAERIRVREDGDETRVSYVINQEEFPCPAVPRRIQGRLNKLLHTLAGVGDVAYASEEPSRIRLSYGPTEFLVEATFSNEDGVETIDIDIDDVRPKFPYL